MTSSPAVPYREAPRVTPWTTIVATLPWQVTPSPAAEDLLDDPTQLGPWADDAHGIWRGLAIMDDAS